MIKYGYNAQGNPYIEKRSYKDSRYTRDDNDRFDENGYFIPYTPTDRELSLKDEIKKALEKELAMAYEDDPMDDYTGIDTTEYRVEGAMQDVAKQFGVDQDFVEDVAAELENEQHDREMREYEWAMENLHGEDLERYYEDPDFDIRPLMMKSSKTIKSSYPENEEQNRFNWSYNGWFGHLQANNNKLPEFEEGLEWFERNDGKPWMKEFKEYFDIYPVGNREKAAFYNALKEVGAINQWGQPLNNSRQIKSGKYFVQVNTDDKVLFDTLQEANISYMQAVENNTPDDYITIGETDGNRIIQYDSSRGMLKNSRQIKSSLEEIDETAARELAICTVNDSDVQPRIKAIIKNLSRKKKNGTYDDSLAAKAFLIAVEDEAKLYDKQYGSGRGSLTMFNKPTRMRAAEIVKEHYDEDIQ